MGFASFATPIDHQAGPSSRPNDAADMQVTYYFSIIIFKIC